MTEQEIIEKVAQIIVGHCKVAKFTAPTLATGPLDIAQALADAGLLADPIAAAVAAQERDELTRDRDSWRRLAENLYQRAEQADETNQRLNRRAQIAESAINELVTGTGRGKCRPVALEIWERCQENHAARCDSGVGCHHPDPCPTIRAPEEDS